MSSERQTTNRIPKIKIKECTVHTHCTHSFLPTLWQAGESQKQILGKYCTSGTWTGLFVAQLCLLFVSLHLDHRGTHSIAFLFTHTYPASWHRPCTTAPGARCPWRPGAKVIWRQESQHNQKLNIYINRHICVSKWTLQIQNVSISYAFVRLYKPRQGAVWQSCVSLSGPMQWDPLLRGGGLMQARVRTCVPVPQVTEQSDHTDHGVQPPSTGNSIYNLVIWHLAHGSVRFSIDAEQMQNNVTVFTLQGN